MGQKQDDLRAFVKTLKYDSEKETYCSEEGNFPRYWFDPNVPFYDFNRELIPAGVNTNYPDGVVGIRTDDDFWSVAALPLEFNTIHIEDLVAILWPDLVDEATYNPDTPTDVVERREEKEDSKS